MTGFQAIESFQLGKFSGHGALGAITYCNSPDFQGVSGIVGIGLPLPQIHAPDIRGMIFPNTDMPPPLHFQLSESNPALRRTLAFTASHTSAELQLGGYDEKSVTGPFVTMQALNPRSYMVLGTELRFGDDVLLGGDAAHFPVLLDSGSSCIVMPGTDHDHPFATWMKRVKNTKTPSSHASFFVKMGGHTFEIPYHTWYINDPTVMQSCVQSGSGFQGLILGDVLFRTHVVMFDASAYPSSVMIGIGKQNPGYKIGAAHPSIQKVVASKAGSSSGKSSFAAPAASDVVAVKNFQNCQFFVNISVGSPRQELTVILDSGSSVFAIFSSCVHGVQLPLRCQWGNCEAGSLAEKPSAMLEHVVHSAMMGGSFSRMPVVLLATACAAFVVAVVKLRSSRVRVSASSVYGAGGVAEYGATSL